MFSYAFLMQVNSKNAEEAWRWLQEWKKIEAYLFNEIRVTDISLLAADAVPLINLPSWGVFNFYNVFSINVVKLNVRNSEVITQKFNST